MVGLGFLARPLGLLRRPRGAHFAPRRPRRRLPVLVVAVLTTALGLSAVGPLRAAAGDEAGITTRVSVASDGSQWPGPSAGRGAVISADGRHVAFLSSAANADPALGSDLGAEALFVHDRLTRTTTFLASATSGDADEGPAGSAPAISADGRHVAFSSNAENLVGPSFAPGITEAPDLIAAEVLTSNSEGIEVLLTFDEPAWTVPDDPDCGIGGPACRGYFLVLDGFAGNGSPSRRAVECSLASGEGTTQHNVDCPVSPGPTLPPRRVYVEEGTVSDEESGGRGNAPQATGVSSFAGFSTRLIDAAIDLAGTTTGGEPADVVVYTFDEPVTAKKPAAFKAYTVAGAPALAAVQATGGSCACEVRAVFPDGSLSAAVGASVDAGAVDAGAGATPNLPDEVELVNPSGDDNGESDVFVFDRDADGDGIFDGTEPGSTRISKVSVGRLGLPSNGDSYSPSISADGRHVAFHSDADNLLGQQPEGGIDLIAGPLPSFAGTAATERAAAPPAPGPPEEPDTNELTDVFVHDRDADGDGFLDEGGSTEVTVRVSVSNIGEESEGGDDEYDAFGDSVEPSMSADGRFVAFTSAAVNLIDTVVVGTDAAAQVVRSDNNDVDDVFVRDRDLDGNGAFDEVGPGRTATVRVSVAPDGSEQQERSHQPALSADGRVVAFTKERPDELDVFETVSDVLVHDRDADANGVFDEAGPGGRSTTDVSRGLSGAPGAGSSFDPAISGDARHVSFTSTADDLVRGDGNRRGERSGADVFARDRVRSVTTRVSVASDGAEGDDDSDSSSSLSGDGRYVTFSSEATNLVPGDTNDVQDVFVRDRIPVARLLPPLADLGAVELGDRSEARTLQLENVGVGPLLVTGVAVVGPAAGDFAVEAEDCTGATLRSEPGQRCRISISFAPGASGPRRASLVVAHDPAPGRRSVASLQGTGLLPPFAVSPDPLDLGSVGVGFSAERTATITNLARRAQSLAPFTIGGAEAPDFSVVGDDCPSSLASRASCTVRIRFAPAAAGSRAASLAGTFGPQPFSLALHGTGVPGLLTLAPDPVDFRDVPLATAADRVVTVGNDGLGLLRVTGLGVGGDDGAEFARVADDCVDVVLAPGATCTATLRLTPAQAGPRRGTLSVEAALAGVAARAESSVDLLGAGLPSQASISPSPVDFGPVDVGIPATATVTVTNDGPGPLTLGPAGVAGPEAGDFALGADGCSGRRLAPGASCVVEVVFVPSAAGDRAASLSIPAAGVVGLQGSGLLFAPVITLSVNLGPPGTVTLVEGTGFRPNAAVRLRWVAAESRADAPAPLTVTTPVTSDGEGRFGPTPVLVFPRDFLGPRTLEARGELRGTFAAASFLVLPGTAQPAGQDVFFIRRTQLVNRG